MWGGGGVDTSRVGGREDRGVSTNEFQHIPIKHIVVVESFSMEKVTEQLAKVGVIGLVIKPH